ncbi:transcription factor SRM1-like isoform X2 [Zingiber officinale]|nr:transcription factor SRM1-like isoform X2 [Zingiber officinale]
MAVPGKTNNELIHHYQLLLHDVQNIEAGLVPLPCYPYSPDQHVGQSHGDSWIRRRRAFKDQERRKGITWTEEEHRLFLLGLETFGKGDWRSISRNFVISRTPTQVASHAQKFFNRLNSTNKERRRTSIHDITIASGGDSSAGSHGIARYGSTRTQSVNGMVPFIPPVGAAPVNLPLADTDVPVAPLNIQPMNIQQPRYPFPPTDR